MKRNRRNWIPVLAICGVLTAAGPLRSGTVQITIQGGSDVFANPGSLTGWGISVYSSDDYLLFTGSQFEPPNSLGTYSDYLASSFFYGIPGAIVFNDFNPLNLTGTGEFFMDPGALLGTSVTGVLEVFWDSYRVSPTDPAFDPILHLVSAGNSIQLPVSVTVGSPPDQTPEAPEAYPLVMLLLGIAMLKLRANWEARRTTRRRLLQIGGVLALSWTSQPAQAQQVVPSDFNAEEREALNIIRFAETFGAATCHTNSDTTVAAGCCGSPGNHGCISKSTGVTGSLGVCTKPDDNQLRIDVSGAVNCLMAEPVCDPLITQGIRNARFGPQDHTFYVTSDLHFFRGSFWVENQIHHVRKANEIPSLNLVWPGTASQKIGVPKGVIVAGDVSLDASSGNLGAYRLLWDRGTIAASVKYPVFFGLGNHDAYTQADATGAKRFYQYLTKRMRCGEISLDSDGANGSGNYSWDWGRLHLIQLNIWAGDQGSLYTHTSDGLTWLRNDLANRVGNSGRPVVIFQHYPLENRDWSLTELASFTAIIAPYNVIGFFAGHTHVPKVARSDDLGVDIADSKSHHVALDQFTAGTGGSNGKGDYVAARYYETAVGSHTDAYLDVASIAWDETGGTRLERPSHGYYGDKPGCHKRVNARFNDITSLIALSHTGSGNSITVTLTKNAGTPMLPAPLALQFRGMPGWVELTTPNFADSCGIAPAAHPAPGVSVIPNSRYVQLDDALVNQLNSGATVSVPLDFALTTASFPPAPLKVVAIGPLRGASPASINIITAAAQIPPVQLQDPGPQTFTIFGPPSAPYSLTLRYTSPNTPGQDWLSIAGPAAGTFNAFGRADVTLRIDVTKLQLVGSEQPSAVVEVTGTDDPFDKMTTVPITVAIKAVTSIQVTVNPPSQYNPLSGTPALFTAKLIHPMVQDPGHGGAVDPTGIMTLSEATLDTNNQVVSTTPITYTTTLNNPIDCRQQFGVDAGLTPLNDTVVMGAAGNTPAGPGYCPSQVAGGSSPFLTASLSRGIHNLVVQYAGDSHFAPATSPVFQYLVARPLASIQAQSGGGQTALIGTPYAAPLVVVVTDQSGEPAPGIPVTFTAPGSGPSGAFPGGVRVLTMRTGPDGRGSLPFVANMTAGTFDATASVAGLAPVLFRLINTPTSGVTRLTVTVASKSGPPNPRTWTFRVANSSYFAAGVRITRVNFTQLAGTACTPIIKTALPLELGDVATGASVTAPNMEIDFGTCSAGSRFTVDVDVQANGGGYQRTMTLGNQFM